ncbi:hypothetical protein ACH5RR_006704 [Cinchona calisaya]|uniref:Uncharacterized protein n=1 Tax=Cinchona calisaya TaxID=153742 RepID=A0ABD3APR2_9GENT
MGAMGEDEKEDWQQEKGRGGRKTGCGDGDRSGEEGTYRVERRQRELMRDGGGSSEKKDEGLQDRVSEGIGEGLGERVDRVKEGVAVMGESRRNRKKKIFSKIYFSTLKF